MNYLYKNFYFSLFLGLACTIPIYAQSEDIGESHELVQESENIADSTIPEGLGKDAEELLLLCKDCDLTVPEESKPSIIAIHAKRIGIHLFYLAHENPFAAGCITGALGMLVLVFGYRCLWGKPAGGA